MENHNVIEVTYVVSTKNVEVRMCDERWTDAARQWLTALQIDFSEVEVGGRTVFAACVNSSQTVECVCNAMRRTGAVIEKLNVR